MNKEWEDLDKKATDALRKGSELYQQIYGRENDNYNHKAIEDKISLHYDDVFKIMEE